MGRTYAPQHVQAFQLRHLEAFHISGFQSVFGFCQSPITSTSPFTSSFEFLMWSCGCKDSDFYPMPSKEAQVPPTVTKTPVNSHRSRPKWSLIPTETPSLRVPHLHKSLLAWCVLCKSAPPQRGAARGGLLLVLQGST